MIARLQYIYLRDIYQTQNIIDSPHFTVYLRLRDTSKIVYLEPT